MAHARRHFFDVFDATKSPVAEEALRRIGALYAIEAEINGRPADVRLAERQARAVPLLAQLKSWLEGERRRLSLKSRLGKAIQYSLGRWDALARSASDGRLAIDNNPAERALRTIAVTRKNFLFLGSDEGGRRAAHIYTIVEIGPAQWIEERSLERSDFVDEATGVNEPDLRDDGSHSLYRCGRDTYARHRRAAKRVAVQPKSSIGTKKFDGTAQLKLV
jgi:hypothetical protein